MTDFTKATTLEKIHEIEKTIEDMKEVTVLKTRERAIKEIERTPEDAADWIDRIIEDCEDLSIYYERLGQLKKQRRVELDERAKKHPAPKDILEYNEMMTDEMDAPMHEPFTEEQKQLLINAYQDLKQDHETPCTMDDVDEAVRDYIDKHGLPETSKHNPLYGDVLDDWLEDHNIDFEDYATILEV